MEPIKARTSRGHLVLYAIIVILFCIDGYLNKVWADHADADIRCGAVLFSNHPYSDEDYNEEHEGLYCSWNGLALGSYTNSYDDQSTFLTYTSILGEWHDLEFSITAGIVNGYPEEDEYSEQTGYHAKGFNGWGEYRPWASLNAKYSVFKVWYAYRVVAVGLEFELF